MDKKTFNSAELLEILQYLDSILARDELVLEIAIYGGAAVMLHFGERARDLTEDIDAVILNRQQFGKRSSIFAEVAKKYGLADDWINSNIINTLSDLKREELISFGKFSSIIIRLPKKEQLLAMKVKSARYYPKNDFDDAQQLIDDLKINTLDDLQQLVEEYIPSFLITKDVTNFMTALMGEQ